MKQCNGAVPLKSVGKMNSITYAQLGIPAHEDCSEKRMVTEGFKMIFPLVGSRMRLTVTLLLT